MIKTPLKDYNESRWAVKIITRGLTELEREHQHLIVKQKTVGLSFWEMERLGDLEEERTGLKTELENASGVFSIP